MSLPVQSPNLPSPPNEYDRLYMDVLLNELVGFIRLLNNPGELRGTILNLSAVPDSPTGLTVGSLYHQGGVLRIMRESDITFNSPAGMSSSLGTVTTSP